MKILAIADTHGDSDLVKKIGEMANKENVDLILHAGDLTWFNEKKEGIIKPLIKKGREILMVHGNHDSSTTIKEFSEIYPGIIDLHKKGIEKEGIGFFGSGTTDWGFVEDEKQVFDELNYAHKKIKHLDKKVMLTHGPPSGSKIELLGFPGSRGVRKAIDKFKPDFVICGHIHEGAGLKEKIGNTKVINVARTPTIFEI